MRITYHINNQASPMLEQKAQALANLRPCLEEIGLVVLGSIARNFKAGGRPAGWPESHRARATKRGKTLIDTARLKNSMTMAVGPTSVSVGTNVKYAAIHQFGGSINKTVLVRPHKRLITQAFGRSITPRFTPVKGHAMRMKITIPARPFLMIQDSDHRVITRIIEDHIGLS